VGLRERDDYRIDARALIATHLPSMPIYDSLRADPRSTRSSRA
jgi:hypothetical protein